MPLWKNTPHLKTSDPFLSHSHPLPGSLTDQSTFTKQWSSYSIAGIPAVLGRSRMQPHRKMILHIADCRSNSSKESLANPQYPLHPCSCCLPCPPHPEPKEHATSAPTRHAFLPWLQIQGGDQAARGWNVGGRNGWWQCLLPTNQRQLLPDLLVFFWERARLPCAAQLLAAGVLSYYI